MENKEYIKSKGYLYKNYYIVPEYEPCINGYFYDIYNKDFKMVANYKISKRACKMFITKLIRKEGK